MKILSSSRGLRAILLPLGLAAVGSASAATLTYSHSVPTTATSFSLGVSLEQFNPTLGALTGITFGFQDTMTSKMSLSNDSTSSTNYLQGTTNGSFSFKNTSNTVNLSDSLTVKGGSGIDVPGAFSVKPSSSAPPFVSPYGGVFMPTTTGATVTGSLTVPSSFSPFIGTGSLPYTYSATAVGTTTGPNGSSPANFTAVYQTTAAADYFVTYTYSPVPEPAPLAALALGALGLVRRRKAGGK